jgi:uncharacterized membrane protein YgcG
MLNMIAPSVRRSLMTAVGSAAATAVLIFAAQDPALAVECKDMEKLQCERNDNCTWVDGYQRKDGVKVAAYCRSKGKRKSGGSASGSGSGSGSSTGSSTN